PWCRYGAQPAPLALPPPGAPGPLRLPGLRRSLTPRVARPWRRYGAQTVPLCLEAKGAPGCASLTRATQKPHAPGSRGVGDGTAHKRCRFALKRKGGPGALRLPGLLELSPSPGGRGGVIPSPPAAARAAPAEALRRVAGRRR